VSIRLEISPGFQAIGKDNASSRTSFIVVNECLVDLDPRIRVAFLVEPHEDLLDDSDYVEKLEEWWHLPERFQSGDVSVLELENEFVGYFYQP
jgi:hypothetical protein